MMRPFARQLPGTAFQQKEDGTVLVFVLDTTKYSIQRAHRVDVGVVFPAVCREIVVL